jgi:hypothetical protein
MRTKRVALSKGGSAESAFMRPESLVQAYVATQTSGCGECVITIGTCMAWLSIGVHADAVVMQQGLVGKRSTALLACQRLLTRVRQQMVLEDGPRVGTPAAKVALLGSGLSQVGLTMLRQIVAQSKPLTTNLARESVCRWLMKFLVLPQGVL